MIRAGLAAWLSHWKRQPGQLLMLVVGIALATGLWSAVQAINGEARANYARALEQTGRADLPILVPQTGTLPLSRYVELRRAGWKLAPVLEGRWRLKTDSIRLMGVDLLNHPALAAVAEASEVEDFEPLESLLAPGRLFAPPELEDELAGISGLPPISYSARIPAETILTDISVAEQLLDRTGRVSHLLILPDQPMGLTPLSQLAPDLTRLEPGRAAETARLTDSFHLNLTAFGLLSFAVGLFIVNATIGLAFEQRRGLVRTLRALGVPLRQMVGFALTELLVFALIAGSVGLVLGYLVAAALLPDVAATLRGLYGAPVEGGLSLRREWVLSGLGMTLGGTVLASAQALWKMAKMPLLSAPGQQAWSVQAGRSQRRQAILGVGLVLAGIAAVLIWDGLLAGFALMAGVMLGAALILPVALAAMLNLGRRTAHTAVTEWIWADTRAQLPGLSLALMALLLALATNVGVGSMVASFRLTFTGWMEQRLISELYVTAKDDAQGHALHKWLEARNVTVLPIRWTETAVAGGLVRVYGVADHSTYRDHWPILQSVPGVWDKINTGTGVLVNEQLARRHGYWSGTRLELAPDWTLPVVGVYSDYGNPHGQAIVALPQLLDRQPDIPNRQFGLRLPEAQVSALMREIREAFDLPAGSLIDQASLRRGSLAVFDKTFVVTAALNILTLGVAAFAMLTSLLTIWRLRQPQLAPVWALGITRNQLARFELLRSLLLAALTAVLALPLGLLMAWILLSVINVEAFGWKLQLYLFPLDWLRLFLLTLLAALLAAALPARALMKMQPGDLLRSFTNER
ncbi:MAG: FtsX-like permease family protein [Rhodobacteraceae bacterium]|nr:FtsX-like permease family protein [Paracoccaceae bacterium]